MLWQTSNGAWALLALAFYLAFPYDLSPESAASRGPLSFAFFASRFPLWLTGMLVFYSFWHVTLYCFGLAGRPFATGRTYNFSKVAHNIFWGVTGLSILVCFENVFAFLWATGRLPYEPDAQAFGTVTGGFAVPSGCATVHEGRHSRMASMLCAGLARFAAALALTPLWRNVHFYFAHRLIHFRPFYLHIHALHHRNTDIEPFAGICMHPVEHL